MPPHTATRTHTDAQPPRRSRRRAWIILALGILGLAVLIERGTRVALAPPGRAGRYVADFDALLKPYRAGDGPDAWAEIAAAITLRGQLETQAYPTTGSQNYDYRFDALYTPRGMLNDGGPTQADIDRAENAVRIAADLGLPAVLDRIAAARRVVRPSPEGEVIGFMLPELGYCRYLARYCAGRMALAARTGDHAERVAAFEHALALGRVCASNFTLIDYLVGVAIHQLAFERLRTDLVNHPLPPEHLRAALAAIDRQPLPSIATAIEGERLGMLDTIEWTHSNLPNNDGHFQPARAASYMGLVTGSTTTGTLNPARWPVPLGNLAGWFLPTKRQTTRRANEMFEGLQRSLAPGIPARERPAVFDADAWLESLPANFVFVRTLVPAFGRALESSDSAAMLRDGTRLALAIELHRATLGSPPDSLDQLVPSILPALPIDAVSGRPFGYKRTSDPAAPTPGYVLFSLGFDAADNNAATDPKDPQRALRRKGAGLDFQLLPVPSPPAQR